jgi:S1-C subfamily serine protease
MPVPRHLPARPHAIRNLRRYRHHAYRRHLNLLGLKDASASRARIQSVPEPSASPLSADCVQISHIAPIWPVQTLKPVKEVQANDEKKAYLINNCGQTNHPLHCDPLEITEVRHMWLRARICARLFACLLFVFCSQVTSGQTTAPAKPDAERTRFRAVRSISGAAGHEVNGRFIMDDARSVFTAGKDARVIVYFEWEGPLGPHHFEGLWKSPEGRIVLISDFRYEAKGPRFTGYWSMLLSDGIPSGEWHLEARIDGEPAGMHSFVITADEASAAEARSKASNIQPLQPLSSAELYRRASEATVTIEKISADGTGLGKGTGFWVGDGQLLTAFDVIDAAASLRITLRDGSQITTDQIIVWNRWQDWALLKVEGSVRTPLKRAANDAPSVGDRCVFLEFGPAGAKLADGSVTGKNSFPKAGERLLVASGVNALSFGGPLLDEFGNYVGIVGESIVPSASPIATLELLRDPGATGGSLDWGLTGLAVPHSLLPDFSTSGTPTRLSQIAAHGEFVEPLSKRNSIQVASLTSVVNRDPANVVIPGDFKRVFSRRENKAVMFVNWQFFSKEKLSCAIRIIDSDNKLLSESKPRDVSLAPGKIVSVTWDIPVGSMPVGIYRADLVIDNKPAWREFFRVTD